MVGWLVGRSVCLLVTHSFDDPHVAPYWPTCPCSLHFFLSFHFSLLDSISTAPYHVEKRLSVHPQAFILFICLFLELGKWERNARAKKRRKKDILTVLKRNLQQNLTPKFILLWVNCKEHCDVGKKIKWGGGLINIWLNVDHLFFCFNFLFCSPSLCFVPRFRNWISLFMKVGQHYYSTLYKGQEPLELLMVFNPDPSQLSLKYLKETSLFRIYHKTFQKICII